MPLHQRDPARGCRHRCGGGDLPRGDSGPAPTSLAAWCALIRAVLASGATASLGLVLHGHGSGDDFEDLPLSAGERVPCGALDEDLLATLREDVGYRFVR